MSITYRIFFLKKQQKLRNCAIKISTTSRESTIPFNKTLFLNEHSHFCLLFCSENFTGAFFAYYNNMLYIWSQTRLSSNMKSELRWQSNVPLTSFWRSRIILLFLSISVFKKLIYNFKEMLSGSCWDVIVNTTSFFMLLKVLEKKNNQQIKKLCLHTKLEQATVKYLINLQTFSILPENLSSKENCCMLIGLLLFCTSRQSVYFSQGSSM